jgi:hypothetical protein
VLRELPSVIGAFVREDVHGHPREDPPARAVRAPIPGISRMTCAICSRSGSASPVDQRVISIAPARGHAGGSPGRARLPRPAPLPYPDTPGRCAQHSRGIVQARSRRTCGSSRAGSRPVPAQRPCAVGGSRRRRSRSEPRVRFTGISIEAIDKRVRVRVSPGPRRRRNGPGEELGWTRAGPAARRSGGDAQAVDARAWAGRASRWSTSRGDGRSSGTTCWSRCW